ncbi:MAG: hypothetical protein QM765_36890 [Myxococcales bacterium]
MSLGTLALELAAEHLEEAAFLFQQWEASLRAPHYTLPEIQAGPEARLLAHLDGLVLGGPAVADSLLVPGLEEDDPGRVFAAAFALAAAEPKPRLDPVAAVLAKDDPVQCASIRRALSAAPIVSLEEELLARFAAGGAPMRGHLLAVLGELRVDPEAPLDALASADEPAVRRLGLSLAARFPHRLNPLHLARGFASPDPTVRCAAVETGLVVALQGALESLQQVLGAPSPARAPATRGAGRARRFPAR